MDLQVATFVIISQILFYFKQKNKKAYSNYYYRILSGKKQIISIKIANFA